METPSPLRDKARSVLEEKHLKLCGVFWNLFIPIKIGHVYATVTVFLKVGFPCVIWLCQICAGNLKTAHARLIML